MSEKGTPVIKEGAKDSWTKITFKPDLSRFHGMTMLDNDTVSLMKRRVFDVAGSTHKSVKVYLDGTKLPIKCFKDYVEMFRTDKEKPLVCEKVNDTWEVCCTISESSFQQVSFVNSIATTKGGKHVDHVVDQIVEKLVAAIKKKHKSVPIKPAHVKNQLSIFINCLIVNPAFNSQTKEFMNSQVKKFGSVCNLSDKFFKEVINSGIVDNILNWAQLKASAELKKTGGKKKGRISGITKLDDANEAGGRNASQCALILTEGDSAKALAVSGLSVVGRDHYGVFPLKGKLLNVRDANHQQLMNNEEIKNILQIMGLQHGKEYEDTRSLRYGHIMIMADQDHDGSHIKGLVINFVSNFWPSLLRIPGFVQEFVTPIVKVTRGSTTKSFFTLNEYDAWKEEHNDGKGWKIKYYKGLGTSTSIEAKEYFSDLSQHKLDFEYTGDENVQDIEMAFSKKKADARKDWLNTYDAKAFVDHTAESLNYSDFIHKELVHFSNADNARSIPSMVDGLKPGQRKVLFACFKRKLKSEIKVAQLAGYVSEHSAYHHGEASLCGTIVNMAQNFTGSNNMNMLDPRGQFGTRLQGGKDAASPRYIFTQLTTMARSMFPQEDDAILNYLTDDGLSVEPSWYMPLLPMVLVNGADGIGTGWSTSVPNYNPQDIIANVRRIIAGEELVSMVPWYRGFVGGMERKPKDPKSFESTGIITVTGDTTVEITELPVKKWTQDYKEFLEDSIINEDQKDAKKRKAQFIKEYKEYHTDTKVKFVVTMPSEKALEEAVHEGLEKKFKLTSSITTSNMHLFNRGGHIRKYETPEDILKSFFKLRIQMYGARKEFLMDKLGSEWRKLDNRVRFILMVIARELVISNRKKKDLLQELKEKGFEQFSKEKKNQDAEGEEEEEAEEAEETEIKAGAYDYLLGMPMWSLTYEKVEQLKQEASEKKAELERITAMSVEEMYEEDLQDFEAIYEEWSTALENEEKRQVKVKGGKGKGKGAKKASKTKASHIMDESDDDFLEDDDSDFDEGPKKAKKKSAPAKAAPPKKAAPAKAVPAKKAPKPTLLSDSDDDEPAPKVTAKAKPVEVKPVVPEQELTLMERLARRNSMGGDETVDRAEAPVPTEAAKKPRRAATKKAPVIEVESDSDEIMDEDSEEDSPIVVKKAPEKKVAAKKAPAPKNAVKAKQVVISDSDEDETENKPPAKQAPSRAKPSGRAAAKKATASFDFDDDVDEEMDDVHKSPPKKSAPKKRALAPKQTKPAATKKVVKPESDSDDESVAELSLSPERASPPHKKAKAKSGAVAKKPAAKKGATKVKELKPAKVTAPESPVEVKRRPGRAAAAKAQTKMTAKPEEEEESDAEEMEVKAAGSEPEFSNSDDDAEESDDGEEYDDDSDF